MDPGQLPLDARTVVREPGPGSAWFQVRRATLQSWVSQQRPKVWAGLDSKTGSAKKRAISDLCLSLFHLVTKIITFEHRLYVDLVFSAADTAMNKTDSLCPPGVLVRMPDLNHHKDKYALTYSHECHE